MFDFFVKSLLFKRPLTFSNTFRSYSKRNDEINAQYILNIKKQNQFHESEVDRFLMENEFIKNKKLISISPGGFKGFYVMGVCKYLKSNYDLDNYIFSGASAGAWNSLLLCFNRDIDEIQYKILDKTLQDTNKLGDIEKRIKNKMLETYSTDDFDLRRLFIGVTTIDKYKSNTTIFTGFDNLEDALNCCIASSHIPLVTGGFTNVYRNILSFDGGFSKYPYLNTSKSLLHITPNIWNNKQSYSTMSINDYTALFSKTQYNFLDMVEHGFRDTEKNKKTLDVIFDIKT